MRRAAASGDLWSLLGRLWSGPLRLPSHFNVIFPFSFLLDKRLLCPVSSDGAEGSEEGEPEVGAGKV